MKFITLTMTHVAPAIVVVADGQATVGASHVVGLTASDSGDDSNESWVIGWKDGTVHVMGSGVTSLSHVYDTPGDYSIEISLIDSDSTPGVAVTAIPHIAVTINRADVSAGGPCAVREGEWLTLQATVVGSPAAVDALGTASFQTPGGLGVVIRSSCGLLLPSFQTPGGAGSWARLSGPEHRPVKARHIFQGKPR